MTRELHINHIWGELEEYINKLFILPNNPTGFEPGYVGLGEYSDYTIDELQELKRLCDTLIELRRFKSYD